MDKEKFLELYPEHHWPRLANFKNHLGQEYIIFTQSQDKSVAFIVGDATYWEVYEIDQGDHFHTYQRAFREIIFTDRETEYISSVLYQYSAKAQEDYKKYGVRTSNSFGE